MHRALVLVVSLGACRMGFDPISPDGAGSGSDAAIGDAALDGNGSGGGGSDGGGGDAAALTCPGNYSPLLGAFNTSRYRIINNTEEWAVAQTDCESDGHHLAIPDDFAEISAMYSALPVQNIWIGVTDRITEGTYRKVTGGVQTYLPWSPGEPDPEDCLFIDGLTSQLVAQDCTSGRRYMCECDGTPADPASY